jgi:hypothetical protein
MAVHCWSKSNRLLSLLSSKRGDLKRGGSVVTEFTISFEGTSVAQANADAQSLETQINRAAPEVETTVRRTDPNAQDFGASLVLVLGTPAMIALAKGIADWLRLRATATTKLKVCDKNGNVILTVDAATSGDVRALVEGTLKDHLNG